MKRLVCALLASSAVFAGATTLTSDLFETPNHTNGTSLNTSTSTPEWFGYEGFKVNNVNPFAGTQCVFVDNSADIAGAAFIWQDLIANPNAGTERVVRTQCAIRWGRTTAAPSSWISGGLLATNVGENMALLRFFSDNGKIELMGFTGVGPVSATLRNTIAENVWNNYELRLDYRTATCSAYLNGQNLGAAFPFLATGYTDTALYNEQNTDNITAGCRYDNYSVETRAGANVSGTASIHGLANPLNSWLQLDFYSGTTLVDSVTGVLNATGQFSVSPLIPNGTYTIIAKGYTTVGRKLTGTVTAGVLSGLSWVNLPNGNINGDSAINLSDFSLLSSAYGGRLDTDAVTAGNQSSANWNPWSDLNQDGVTNLSDFSILSTNYGAKNDLP